MSAATPASTPHRPDRARLQLILSGGAKPANESEAMGATMAILWKKAFETATRPMQPETDPLAGPQSEQIREQQAGWMGIEAVVALGASIGAQVRHLQAPHRPK